jgi:hypothetical protein
MVSFCCERILRRVRQPVTRVAEIVIKPVWNGAYLQQTAPFRQHSNHEECALKSAHRFGISSNLLLIKQPGPGRLAASSG